MEYRISKWRRIQKGILWRVHLELNIELLNSKDRMSAINTLAIHMVHCNFNLLNWTIIISSSHTEKLSTLHLFSFPIYLYKGKFDGVKFPGRPSLLGYICSWLLGFIVILKKTGPFGVNFYISFVFDSVMYWKVLDPTKRRNIK